MKKSIAIALLAAVFLTACTAKPPVEIPNVTEKPELVATEPSAASVKLSGKGVFKIVDTDLNKFSKKTIPQGEKVVLSEDFKEETGKNMAVIGDILFDQNPYGNRNILYRFDAKTLKPIDKKELPKPAPLPTEADFPDGAKAFNNVSFCENAIVAAQPTKVIVYDENVSEKAAYDIKPDTEYAKNNGYSGAVAIDETHIIYCGKLTDNYIMDLKTGAETLIDNKLDAEKSMSKFGQYLPNESIFIKSVAYKTGLETAGDGPYVYPNYAKTGELIDFCYEQTLKENGSFLSAPENTIYSCPKDDVLVKNLTSSLTKNSRTSKDENRLLLNNGLAISVSDNLLVDFTNQVIYDFPAENSTDDIQKITASCVNGGETFVLIAPYDNTSPNFLLKLSK
ncbi:MAG: hypothetical protein RR540_00695 [Oscillospiraceae bacterium]